MRRCSAIFSGGETSRALRSAKPLQWATPVRRELRARFCYGEREKQPQERGDDTISALAAKADIWLEIRKSPINDDFTRNPNGNTSLRPLFSAAGRIPHRLLARVAIRGLAHGEVR